MLVVLAKSACSSSGAYQVHVRACVGVCVSGNDIGASGVTAVAEALKVNTSVLEIDLYGEWCWWCLPSVHVAAVVLTQYVCVCQRMTSMKRRKK